MDWVLYLIPLILALVLVIPTAWVLGRTYRRFRHTVPVRCPETGGMAVLDIDAREAVRRQVEGDPRLPLLYCSLWHDGHDCARECLRRLELTPAMAARAYWKLN